MADPDRTQTIAPREASTGPGDVALAPTVDDSSRGSGSGGNDRRTPSWRDEGAAPVSLPVDDPDRYELAGEHARGGLGRVVRAIDRRLGRTVAVKELLKQSTLAESLFVREALITARLQHPGIVPVHEAGRWPNGEPYYVMRLVQGRTLKELVAEARTPRDRLALLSHVIAVADAIGYAHSEQVIHRDVKPSNVVVGPHGETVVVDWGLARDGRREVPEIDADAVAARASSEPGASEPPAVGRTSTVSGKVIGTPAYMAPEQARGGIVDERADVYAIGAVLYELLSGDPPFSGDTPQAVLDRVTGGPPRPLAEAAPTLPPDLVAIVDKAMSREACDRYDTAKELAADLKRFANGQLVLARRYGTFQLVRRWVSRHRGVVAVAAIAALALLLSGVGFVRRIVEERNLARTERAKAIDAAAAAESRQAELVRLQAHTSLRRDPTAAVAWIKAYPQTAPHQDELGALLDEALALGVARHVFRQDGFVYTVEFSPDGKWVTTASMDHRVRIYDVATGAVRVLGEQPSAVRVAHFTRDGRAVITAGDDGGVRLWPVTDGTMRVLLEPDSERLHGVDVSIDGKEVLVGRKGKGIVVMIEDPAKVTEMPLPKDTFVITARDDWRRSIMISPDGMLRDLHGTPLTRLPGKPHAVGTTHDGEMWFAHVGGKVYSGRRTGGTPEVIGTFDGATKEMHVSDDGRWLAVMGESHDIFVYDRVARSSRVLRGHADQLYDCVFTPDGRRMISASDDGTARIWDLATGESIVLRGHDDDVWDVALSPAGDVVATASLDGSIRIWDLGIGAGMGPENARVDSITVIGDRAIAVGPAFVSEYDLKSGVRTPLFQGDQSAPMWQSAFAGPFFTVSDDGKTIAAFDGKDVAVRGPADAKPRLLKGHRDLVTRVAMTADGTTVYSASRDGSVREWIVATGVTREIFTGKDSVYAIALGADGRIALTVGDSHTMFLIAKAGEPAREVGRGNEWCSSNFPLSFDQHSRLLFARCDSSIAVWTPDGGLKEIVGRGNQAIDLAISADGKRLAGAMNDRSVKVWDALTGELIRELRGHTDLVLDVEWSPDGRLASSSYDRTIRVWNIETGGSSVLRGHSRAVESVRWLDGGSRLISGSRDGVLRMWPAPPATAPSPDEVRATLHRVTTARIGDDDRPTTYPEQSK